MSEERPTAVLVGVQLPGVTEAELASSLAELKRLLDTLGIRTVGAVTQRLPGVGRGAVLGTGKLKELARYTGGTGVVPKSAPKAKPDAEEELEEDEEELEERDDDPGSEVPHATIVAVDHEISPRQLRNLERATSATCYDRTGVIIEIFHRHARSREARLQVEIARLNYTAPRLRETGGTERQRGGIGGKGAGESDLELDRRKIRDRVAELRRELADIEGEARVRRARRQEQLRVALVGYTNAGKSSLMRALTGSDVLVEDKLFATLDTTVRALWPESRPRVLVTDTVGFIKKLPHDLVASFRSTLDEALEATLLLHVVDAADPDWPAQHAVTREVLAEIGAGDIDTVLVLNKCDRLTPEEIEALLAAHPGALAISAKDPADVRRVRDHVLAHFALGLPEVELLVPYDRSAAIGQVHQRATVVGESWEEAGVRFTLRAPEHVLEQLRALVADQRSE